MTLIDTPTAELIDDEKPASLPSPNPTSSFWHSEPSEFLLGHRTTPDLPENADIVIIGSGITGAFAAWYLQELCTPSKKLDVVMLEAREACWGATGRNGGHCQPLLYEQPSPIAAFELKNYHAVKDFIARHRVACEHVETEGGVHAFLSGREYDAAKKEVERLKGTEFEKLVSTTEGREELRELGLAECCVGAVQQHGLGSKLWPYKLVAWILESLVKSGGLNLQTTTPALKLTRSRDLWKIDTARGILKAPQVILATNAYTSYLLPDLFTGLITPARGQMTALTPSSLPGEGKKVELRHTYVFIGGSDRKRMQDDYLIQRPFSSSNKGGQLMFGGARSYAPGRGIGIDDDSTLDAEVGKSLKGGLVKYLGLEGDEDGLLDCQMEWTGIMGASRDGRPWVGGVPGHDGVWVCAGYSGHGMPNAMLSARFVAESVLAVTGGEDMGNAQTRLIEEGAIPAAYLVTEERISKAKKRPRVSIMYEPPLGGGLEGWGFSHT